MPCISSFIFYEWSLNLWIILSYYSHVLMRSTYSKAREIEMNCKYNLSDSDRKNEMIYSSSSLIIYWAWKTAYRHMLWS